jgi:hypothetical protein
MHTLKKALVGGFLFKYFPGHLSDSLVADLHLKETLASPNLTMVILQPASIHRFSRPHHGHSPMC